MPQIRIGQFPGNGVNTITVPDGTTVAAAIGLAGLNPQGLEIRHQGKQVSATEAGAIQVTEGDSVLLTRRISGNIFRRLLGRARLTYALIVIK